ncbi:MAG: 30S ribosomal protein S14 [Cyanobacteria bacterium J06642_2]
MAKKSMIARDKKRARMVEKYRRRREELKEALRNPELDSVTRLELHGRLQKLPRNSAPSRRRNRCWVTGRPRGVFRDFGLSRHCLREMALEGLLPGVVKSSW